MPKPLCKTKKSGNVGNNDSVPLVRDASHVCRTCDRVAKTKKKLCKPAKLAAAN